jgi:hypothetical protein
MKASKRIQNWGMLRAGGVATITLYPDMERPLVGAGTAAEPLRRVWWAEQTSVFGRIEFVNDTRALVRDTNDFLHEIRADDRRGGCVERISFRGGPSSEQQSMYWNWHFDWLVTLDARREEVLEEGRRLLTAGKSQNEQRRQAFDSTDAQCLMPSASASPGGRS